MIDVVFADQAFFHVGIAEILADIDDVCLMAQPRSAEQLLCILGTLIPHVLVLSTSFLPAFPKIESVLERRRTALLLLAEENDHIADVHWLRAQGIVYRSIDGPTLIDAMHRMARGELFVQDRSSDVRKVPSEDNARGRILPGVRS
jgi:DNA-binding NarL/FixJ family response regulator